MFFILPAIFAALAAFFSLASSITLIASFFILKKLLFGGLFLTCGLPTLASAAAFGSIKRNDKFAFVFQFLIPCICMILFVCHPVAGSAFLYSFYWFIPMVLYFSKSQNTLCVALSSTFVAHAVGSVMWLYSTNMSAEQWLALIPVVAFERLVAVLGIVFFYMLIKFCLNFIGIKLFRPVR